uniref:L1 transposable element RRM domain-containing protein n=1 Tax=Poecilia formosa TaxID=48698 RepID=A0A096M8P7_POEFO
PNITNLFSEVVKMRNMLQSVVADVSTIKQATSEAETRISRLEDTSERLHTAVGERSKLTEAMLDRMQALENHSKRNNVRVIGLKETIGTDGTLLSCARKMLTEGLGVRDDAEFEIERAHRAFAPLPDPNRAPVLIRFLRQSARDKVIMAAKEKRGFEWQDCRPSVFPDMTKELAEKRKAFTAVKKKLQE